MKPAVGAAVAARGSDRRKWEALLWAGDRYLLDRDRDDAGMPHV
jgi:hypothetical protein